MKVIILFIVLTLMISCGGAEDDAVSEFCNDLTAKHFKLSDPAERVIANVFYEKCIEIYSE